VEKAFEIMKRRRSVRSYSDKSIESHLFNELGKYCHSIESGPFGVAVRFKLLDLSFLSNEELRSLGTYGIIRGAQHYILGAVREGPGALEDFGYCFEKIILKATSMDLGTCWLGGTFRRGSFAAKMNLGADEMLPAIAPVGYPAEEQSTADRVLRFGAGSKTRKPWDQLFFSSDGKTALDKEEADKFHDVLEAVRIGPSASNRQPWRITRNSGDCYHLYLKENKLYNRIMGKFRMQFIDMGIAMCHFELAAREYRLPGRWQVNMPAPHLPGLHHIATWTV